MPLEIRPKNMARQVEAAVSFNDCKRLVLPYHAVRHATDETNPNDPPPRMGAKSTTHSDHPSTQWLLVAYHAGD